ncbi:metallophosphoesterase family protein [Bacteroidota bacterium]
MNKRLFAIGDIHGCYKKFHALIEENIQIKNSDKIILLGDYIDRGSQSKEVVDYIIDLQNKGFNIVPLIGNHEAMLLDAYNNNEFLSRWIQNGGSETLKSFGIGSVKGFETKYLEFFKGLNHYVAIEEFLFVHAGFNDNLNNPFEDRYHMIWVCREKYKHPFLKDKTIIHGHSPISESFCNENLQAKNQVINIDTGCVYAEKVNYGKLTAIELYSKVLFSI